MSEETSYAPLLSPVSLSAAAVATMPPTATTNETTVSASSTTSIPDAEHTGSTKTLFMSSSSNQDTLLPKLLLGDVLIGSSVTFCISPFVAMVDQAIVQRSAGTHTIMASVQSTFGQMFRHPTVYFRSTPFLWMWALYAATYSTANSLKTWQESVHNKQDNHSEVTNKTDRMATIMCTSPSVVACSMMTMDQPVSNRNSQGNYRSESLFFGRSISSLSEASTNLLASSVGLLVGTSAVNMTMSLLKDRAYARMFGTQQPSPNASKPLAVPKMSYALWMTRDFIVVGSSFLLPDMVVTSLLKQGYIDHTQTQTTLRSAQFMIPVLSQIVAGPIHLLGLNVYQRPSGITALERLRCFQNGALTSVVAARMARILPGYSFGGVGNTYMRDQWRNWVKATA